jgi:hypothetical protein
MNDEKFLLCFCTVIIISKLDLSYEKAILIIIAKKKSTEEAASWDKDILITLTKCLQ